MTGLMLFGYVRSCDIRILYLCESALLVVIWPRYIGVVGRIECI